MMTLLDVLAKIAWVRWVRYNFLSQGKILDILIRCARKLRPCAQVRLNKSQRLTVSRAPYNRCTKRYFMLTRKILNLLGRCLSYSESSMEAQAIKGQHIVTALTAFPSVCLSCESCPRKFLATTDPIST